ncbi:S1C family serine protease [Olsenella sp. HMSC062G07]|uniref:S1C family serine protease n=1 Tax=Olsenella sp. HMSC062G07 TaxID=1739330 RepID=UPI0009F2F3C6|nr:trypsin-like peptidase domain-containing protein [Olsenella sp. HMSC062G07]
MTENGLEGRGEPGSSTGRVNGADVAQDASVQATQTHARPVRSALVSLVAGALGAGLLVLALKATGVIGGTQIIKTTQSGAGQTVNITASDADATTAQAVAAKDLSSVVSLNVTTAKGTSLGSGVILDADGNIITNYHVISGATSITVTVNNKSYDATVVGTDPSSDIAVVHVNLDGEKVTPIEVGNSDALTVGEWVMTIGSPFGLDQSVSAGIVSSLSRNTLLSSRAGETIYTNLIQVDAAINPGNSGGALVDGKGRLVGICTLFSSDTQSFAGIGFAIPGNYAVNLAKKIIAGETVTHAYVGLSMQTVNAQNATANHFAVQQGAYVAGVTDGGPAASAGIQKGDIITAVNGDAITSADGMILAVRSHDIGDTIAVTFMRGDREQTVNVTLGSDEALQRERADASGLGPDSDSSSTTQDQDISPEDLYNLLQRMYGQEDGGGRMGR